MKIYLDSFLEECKLDDIHQADPHDPEVRAALTPDVVAKILSLAGDKSLDAFVSSYAGSHSSTNKMMGVQFGMSVQGDNADIITNTAKYLMEAAGPTLAIKQLTHEEHMRKMDESLSVMSPDESVNKRLRDRVGTMVDTERYVRKDFTEDYIKNSPRDSFGDVSLLNSKLPRRNKVVWKLEEKDDTGHNFVSWNATEDKVVNQWYGKGSKGRVYVRKMPKEENLRMTTEGDVRKFDLILSIEFDQISEGLLSANPDLRTFSVGKKVTYDFMVGEANGEHFYEGELEGSIIKGISGHNMFGKGMPVVVDGLLAYSVSIPGTYNMPVDRAGFKTDVDYDIKIAYNCLNEMIDQINLKGTEASRDETLKDLELLTSKCDEMSDLTVQASTIGVQQVETARLAIDREGKRKINAYVAVAITAASLEAVSAAATIAAALTTWFPGVGLAANVASIAATAAALGANMAVPGRYEKAIKYIQHLSGHFASRPEIGPLGKLNLVTTEAHAIVNKYGPAASVTHRAFGIISGVMQGLYDDKNSPKNNPNGEPIKSVKDLLMELYYKDETVARDGIRIGMVEDSLKAALIAEWVADNHLPDSTDNSPVMPESLKDLGPMSNSFMMVTQLYVGVVTSAQGIFFSQSRIVAATVRKVDDNPKVAQRTSTSSKAQNLSSSRMNTAINVATGIGGVMGLISLVMVGFSIDKINKDGEKMRKEIEKMTKDLAKGYTEMSKILTDEVTNQ